MFSRKKRTCLRVMHAEARIEEGAFLKQAARTPDAKIRVMNNPLNTVTYAELLPWHAEFTDDDYGNVIDLEAHQVFVCYANGAVKAVPSLQEAEVAFYSSLKWHAEQDVTECEYQSPEEQCNGYGAIGLTRYKGLSCLFFDFIEADYNKQGGSDAVADGQKTGTTH